MLQTVLEIAEIRRYFADVKSDYYHKSAIKLLRQYDFIGVGNAKMHALVKDAGSVLNRKTREHAIAGFVAKLKDKASLSVTPKAAGLVPEENTSKTCSGCGKINSEVTMFTREWTCPACGLHHDRNVNAAINIQRKFLASEAEALAKKQ